MRKCRATASALLTALCLTARLFAQVNATGTFSGQVTDPSGSSVANAQVKITDQGTGIVTTKQTASDGYYTAS
ncbi:MAG: carboxypeptidase regulatory-like domain-containing protein, partial [Acidobacteriaceae bacterium]|nr:carboxypeptidase regulatory-like domain-containing protein [Acidobacteriaceae bacterium]